ncbi:MAG: hypothetical protein ACLFVX_06090 [Archaeoglobaceae archaeon]
MHGNITAGLKVILIIIFVVNFVGCSQQSEESANLSSVYTPTQAPTSTVTVTPLETYLIDFGKVNVTAEVYSDDGENRLVAELPDGRIKKQFHHRERYN